MTSARVTWIGHASALLDLDGERVLVDPLGRRRCRALPRYRAVLITHAHIDHLSRWTLATLDREAELVVPRGAAGLVADLGFRSVTEVEPGDALSVAGLDVISVPTKHDPGRWRKGDGPSCTGYVVHRAGVAIHHAGDVDMSTYEVFDDIGKRFDLDATLLPIGGMLPVWYYRLRQRSIDQGVHIDPDTALHIFERLGARRMIPVHWGTLNLRLGPANMPRRRLEALARTRQMEDVVAVLEHGGQVVLDHAGRPLLSAPVAPSDGPVHILREGDAVEVGEHEERGA